MAWKPDYTTTADFKSYARIPDTADDALIGRLIKSASRIIDGVTRRQFGNTTGLSSRAYPVARKNRSTDVFVSIDDIYDLDDTVVTFNADDITESVEFYPMNALANGKVYEEINLPGGCSHGTLIIASNFGWSAVPDDVKVACEMLVNRLLQRRDAPFGVIGSAEFGNQMFVAKNDPDISALLKPFYRWWS